MLQPDRNSTTLRLPTEEDEGQTRERKHPPWRCLMLRLKVFFQEFVKVSDILGSKIQTGGSSKQKNKY